MTDKPDTKELWTYAQIAELTGKSPATLRVWRNRGKLPNADYFIGEIGWPAWNPSTVKEWWTNHEDNPEREPKTD